MGGWSGRVAIPAEDGVGEGEDEFDPAAVHGGGGMEAIGGEEFGVGGAQAREGGDVDPGGACLLGSFVVGGVEGLDGG